MRLRRVAFYGAVTTVTFFGGFFYGIHRVMEVGGYDDPDTLREDMVQRAELQQAVEEDRFGEYMGDKLHEMLDDAAESNGIVDDPFSEGWHEGESVPWDDEEDDDESGGGAGDFGYGESY